MAPAEIKADLKILVAEDNFVNRTLLKKIFDKLGYPADLAHDGQEALNAFDVKDYDLVFMDIEMPVLNGFETTKILRERFKNNDKRLVIIALTANSMSGERERCLKNGMDDYLAKPFDIEDVERILVRVAK
jgi:CheY-like chemotaxis protein